MLLDLASGHEIPLQGREDFKWGGMVVFSTDTRFVAVSVRDRLGVWDVPVGHRVLDDRLESEITVISFSPEGETIAAGGKNGATDIWQLSDGQRIARVMVVAAAGRQSVPPVTAAALSPHGEYLLTTTRGATRIWAVSVESLTRQVSARIAGDLTTAEWKAFAGDERRLTSIHPTR